MFVGVIEFLGWFGAVTVLAGYLLFSLGKIPNGPVYQLFNLVGGVSVAVNVAAHHAVPSTIVNGIWAVVAAVVLVRMGLRRARGRRATGSSENRLPDLHAELPATTAVVPVIGPALRDHDDDVTSVADAAPSLPAVEAPGAGAGASTGTGTGTDAPRPDDGVRPRHHRDDRPRPRPSRDPTARDPTARDPTARDPTARDPAAPDPARHDPAARRPRPPSRNAPTPRSHVAARQQGRATIGPCPGGWWRR
ncbi:hypothetical protein [Curtobacterium sp. MCPF17_052]|uniref:CBU_0592 family membrane protein n=1 Tax=Curtobacterium sp. MCPF17_052 TaxID=2175655 RepID=UPI0024DF86A4|nr:hypothetical protein [Curtobacterium sp. MCPF17_052]WIB13716.1 hypothetical protein DEJ36_08545 [Curtobacterium sp. MCPF17_052]